MLWAYSGTQVAQTAICCCRSNRRDFAHNTYTHTYTLSPYTIALYFSIRYNNIHNEISAHHCALSPKSGTRRVPRSSWKLRRIVGVSLGQVFTKWLELCWKYNLYQYLYIFAWQISRSLALATHTYGKFSVVGVAAHHHHQTSQTICEPRRTRSETHTR